MRSDHLMLATEEEVRGSRDLTDRPDGRRAFSTSGAGAARSALRPRLGHIRLVGIAEDLDYLVTQAEVVGGQAVEHLLKGHL